MSIATQLMIDLHMEYINISFLNIRNRGGKIGVQVCVQSRQPYIVSYSRFKISNDFFKLVSFLES